jgi:hypothetical protein
VGSRNACEYGIYFAKLNSRPSAAGDPIGLLVVLYAISFLTLPAIEPVLHERLVKLGWIDK